MYNLISNLLFLLNVEYLLWHLFMYMYRTLVFSRLVRLLLIWPLKKCVHLVLAVDCHAVLFILFGHDWEVGGCDWSIAKMIHCVMCVQILVIVTPPFRPLTLFPYSCPDRLSLHRWLCIHTQYRWLEAEVLHHFTLNLLESLIFPILVEFCSILKVGWVNDLCVLNDSFFPYLTHQFLRVLGDLGPESAQLGKLMLLS